MREFFNGWRRKVGCVTLVMACGLMGVWMRSLLVTDFYSFPRIGPSYILVESSWGSFQWNRISSPLGDMTSIETWTAPYWWIVIPLTLLSAWLLLNKPDKSTPKKITEPTANEGATS